MRIEPVELKEAVEPPAMVVARRQSPAVSSFAATLEEASETDHSSTRQLYTVRRGDTLSHIAADALRKVGKSFGRQDVYDAVERLAQANNIANPNQIAPNQRLDVSAIQGSSRIAPAATVSLPPVRSQAKLATVDALLAESVARRSELDVAIKKAQEAGEAAASDRSALRLQARRLSQYRGVLSGLNGPGGAKGLTLPPYRRSTVSMALDSLGLGPKSARTLAPSAVAKKEAVATHPLTGPWSNLLGEPAVLTSEFGIRKDPFSGRWEHHDGIDLAAPSGSTIFPLMPGKVVYSGWKTGYGNVVIVRHDKGVETVYGHNEKNLVSAGDAVTEKTELAQVGSTGSATGSHLHFEIRKKGKAINPVPQLTSRSLQVAKAAKGL